MPATFSLKFKIHFFFCVLLAALLMTSSVYSRSASKNSDSEEPTSAPTAKNFENANQAEDDQAFAAAETDKNRFYDEYMDEGLFALIENRPYDAVQAFERALEQKPKNRAAKKALKAAIKKTEQLNTASRDEDRDALKIAHKHFKNDQPLLAVTLLQEIIQRSPHWEKPKKLLHSIDKAVDAKAKKFTLQTPSGLLYEGIHAYAESRYGCALQCWQELTFVSNEFQFMNFTIEQTRKWAQAQGSTDVSSACLCPATYALAASEPGENNALLFGKSWTGALVQVRDLIKEGRLLAASTLIEQVLREESQNADALALQKECNARKKKETDKLYRAGLAAFAVGDTAEAYEQWQKVLQLDPNHSRAKKVLIKAFFQTHPL